MTGVGHAVRDLSLLPRYAPTMRQNPLTQGTQAEILAALDAHGKERADQGRTDKAEAIAEAWRAVRDGETVVRVGDGDYAPIYRVVRDEDDWM